MIAQQKYKNVKPVYCDRETGVVGYERNSENDIRFDSTAEFHCYRILQKYFDRRWFDISCHSLLQVGGIKWKIDFQITARHSAIEAGIILAGIVNGVHGTSHTSLQQIFVEYKGFQDKNFIAKMTTVACNAPHFAKTILLVSDYTSAFGCYDKKDSKFYCHPVMSSAILADTLRKHTGKDNE